MSYESKRAYYGTKGVITKLEVIKMDNYWCFRNYYQSVVQLLLLL